MSRKRYKKVLAPSDRCFVTLEHRCHQGVYRYHTSKNRVTQAGRMVLRKYSPVTRRHELFKEIK